MLIRWQTAFADVPAATVDAAHSFWAAVTNSTPGEPTGDRLELLPLEPPSGDAALWLQRIDRAEGGWHLDLHVDDVRAAVSMAQPLGASAVRVSEDLVTMSSPGGIAFCLVDNHGRPRRRPAPTTWPGGGRSLLDQICFDIPASRYDDECSFWALLTGWELQAGGLPEFRRLSTPSDLPLQVLLQRLEPDDAQGIRAHLDFSADDVDAEGARHEALGAEVVRRMPHWTTLRDPAGLHYCITDRTP
jgi:predicted enzyme related to lactoylglutathione lyase